MKRIVSIIMSLALVIAMMPISIYADTQNKVNFTITAEKNTVVIGTADEIEFKVTMGAVTNLQTLQFDLDIPNGLEYIGNSAKLSTGLKEKLGVEGINWTEETKRVTAYGSGAYTSNTNTEILSFKCRVSKDASVGNAIVSIKDFANADNAFNALISTVTSKEIAITKALSTLSITGNPSKTYDATPVSDPAVSKTGSNGAVTYEYFVDKDCTTKTTETNSGAAAEGAAPKNAGTYYVKASLAEDASYEGASSERTFTINRADYSYNYAGETNYNVGNSYPQEDNAAIAEGVSDEEVKGTLTWYTDKECTKLANGTFTKEGSETLFWKFTPASTEINYVTTAKTGQTAFTISSLPLQVFKEGFDDNEGKVYGDAEFDKPAALETADGGAITYSSSNEDVATVDETSGKVTIIGAGSTVITATAAEVPEKYARTSVSYELSVDPKRLTEEDLKLSTDSETTKVYDGNDNANPIIKVVVKEDSLVKPTDEIKIDGDARFDSKNVDATKIIITILAYSGSSGNNYMVDAKDLEFSASIQPKPIIVTVDSCERIYKTENPSFSGKVGEGALAEGDTYNDLKMQYSTAATVDSNVGVYDVTGTSSNNNYDVTVEGTGKLSIIKAEPNADNLEMSEDKNVTYDGTPKAVVVSAAAGITGMGDITVKYNGDATVPVNAGTYEVTADIAEGTNYSAISGIVIGNYTIAPKTIIPSIVIQGATTFTGVAVEPEIQVKDGNDVISSDQYTVSYADNIDAGQATITVLPQAEGNYTWTTEDATEEFTIAKADRPTLVDLNLPPVKAGTEATLKGFISGIPSNAKPTGYSIGSYTDANSILKEAPVIDQTTGEITVVTSGAGNVDDTVTIPVTVAMKNYADAQVNVVLTLTDKDTPIVSVKPITVTYSGTALNDTAIQGTAKLADGTVVEGTWAFKAGQELTNVTASGNKTVVFTPKEDQYAVVEATVNVTIKQAPTTAQISFEKVTSEGKTLADITPTGLTGGTFTWEQPDSTKIEANKSYAWTFVPDDALNYETLTGSVTPWQQTTGGGGGGIAMPDVQKPEVTAGEGVKVTLSKDGTTAKIEVEEGYEISDVTVNGVSQGKVTEVTGLKTGDKLVVAAVKKDVDEPSVDNERIMEGVQNTKVWITKTSKGKGWIKINYKKSKGFKVDYYEVYRKAGKNSKFGTKAFYKTKKNGLTGWYKNTKSLKKGTRYYYKVRGVRVIDGKKYYTKWSKTYYRIAK